jgi:nicotinamidase-related amidase
MWPDHCIMNTFSAENNPSLVVADTDAVVKKGYHCNVDSYSAFWDNGHIYRTDLQAILDAADIDEAFFVGLALDFCVYYSAMDSQQIGYQV